ncbi:Polyadenylate-binding protein-interacting protein 8 [Diplonema papillatum]|nr:Polyadenylate-binding protein-interacting protein 8 [Diplonema papillatum]
MVVQTMKNGYVTGFLNRISADQHLRQQLYETLVSRIAQDPDCDDDEEGPVAQLSRQLFRKACLEQKYTGAYVDAAQSVSADLKRQKIKKVNIVEVVRQRCRDCFSETLQDPRNPAPAGSQESKRLQEGNLRLLAEMHRQCLVTCEFLADLLRQFSRGEMLRVAGNVNALHAFAKHAEADALATVRDVLYDNVLEAIEWHQPRSRPAFLLQFVRERLEAIGKDPLSPSSSPPSSPSEYSSTSPPGHEIISQPSSASTPINRPAPHQPFPGPAAYSPESYARGQHPAAAYQQYHHHHQQQQQQQQQAHGESPSAVAYTQHDPYHQPEPAAVFYDQSQQQAPVSQNRRRQQRGAAQDPYPRRSHHHQAVRTECTVYVVGIDANLGEGELLAYVKDFGALAKVRLCGDRSNPTIYGFFEYESPEAAAALVEQSGVHLGAFHLQCSIAREAIRGNDQYEPKVRDRYYDHSAAGPTLRDSELYDQKWGNKSQYQRGHRRGGRAGPVAHPHDPAVLSASSLRTDHHHQQQQQQQEQSAWNECRLAEPQLQQQQQQQQPAAAAEYDLASLVRCVAAAYEVPRDLPQHLDELAAVAVYESAVGADQWADVISYIPQFLRACERIYGPGSAVQVFVSAAHMVCKTTAWDRYAYMVGQCIKDRVLSVDSLAELCKHMAAGQVGWIEFRPEMAHQLQCIGFSEADIRGFLSSY